MICSPVAEVLDELDLKLKEMRGHCIPPQLGLLSLKRMCEGGERWKSGHLGGNPLCHQTTQVLQSAEMSCKS